MQKKKLKQRLKKVYQIHFGIIRHDGSYNIRFILTNTKSRIRIPKNQCLPNTPSRCFNFSFTVEGHSNLNCLQGRVEKAGKKLQLKINFNLLLRNVVKWSDTL